MSVIPQTPELPGSFVLLVPYQGSALDPLGILSSPQTPRLLTPPLPQILDPPLVATFEKHIFLSQTDLTRTGVISNSYNEMFEA